MTVGGHAVEVTSMPYSDNRKHVKLHTELKSNHEHQERIRKALEVHRETLRTHPHSKRVGNYLIGKALGEGSFAKVKEAMHTLTGQKVAIKVIDKKKVKADAYIRKNLKRETRLLQMVNHPNIVKLYETMETENSYYIVTELCEGGELMDRICAKRMLDEREVRRFMRQILSAVYYLHSAGVLHRDLKIENLLFDVHKNIKLIDFGLSNSVKVTRTSNGGHRIDELLLTQCGSPAYAAPELLAHKKYGPSVDVWSIGVNMYAMLTGSLPFTVVPFHIKTLLSKMMKGEMNPMPTNASKNCRDLLRRLLNPVPELRISVKDAMDHPWIVSGPSGAIEKVVHPNRLHADSLHSDILEYMSKHLEFKLGDVIRSVITNTPSSACSTYHLLDKKLDIYRADQRVSGNVSAAEDEERMGSRKKECLIPRRIDVKVFPKPEDVVITETHRISNSPVKNRSQAKVVAEEHHHILTPSSTPRGNTQHTTRSTETDEGSLLTPVVGVTMEVAKQVNLKTSARPAPVKDNGKTDGVRETAEEDDVQKHETFVHDGSPIKKVVIHRRKIAQCEHSETQAKTNSSNKQDQQPLHKATVQEQSTDNRRLLPELPHNDNHQLDNLPHKHLNKPCSKQEMARLAQGHVSSSEETCIKDAQTITPRETDLRLCMDPKRTVFRHVGSSVVETESPRNIPSSTPSSRHRNYKLHTWNSVKKAPLNVSDLKFVMESNKTSKTNSLSKTMPVLPKGTMNSNKKTYTTLGTMKYFHSTQ